MKLIDAAESGYSSANSYFLLMWTVVALVGLTTFFEVREIAKSRAEAARVIALYDEMFVPVQVVTRSLTQAIVAGPHFDDTKKALSALRANSLRARVVLAEVQRAVAAREDLSVDERKAVQGHLNFLLAMTFYNVDELADIGFVSIPEAAKLRAADTEAGSIGIATTVPELRIDDAARLLWLSTIPMRDILAGKDGMLDWATSEDKADFTRLSEQLERYFEQASLPQRRQQSMRLWTAWRKAVDAVGESRSRRVEKSAIERVTLNDPVALTIEAFQSEQLAKARARGGKVDVKLPGFALPLRLADILIFMPGFLMVCLSAIYIYTSRGLRYGTRANLDKDDNHQIVGKTPVYLLLHGVSRRAGQWFASCALILPLVAAILLAVAVVPAVLQTNWAKCVFGLGVAACIGVLIKLFQQVPKVTELIHSGTTLLEETDVDDGTSVTENSTMVRE